MVSSHRPTGGKSSGINDVMVHVFFEIQSLGVHQQLGEFFFYSGSSLKRYISKEISAVGEMC